MWTSSLEKKCTSNIGDASDHWNILNFLIINSNFIYPFFTIYNYLESYSFFTALIISFIYYIISFLIKIIPIIKYN